MTFFEWFYKALIVQSVCVLIVFSSVIFMRFFMPKSYEKVSEFYLKNFTTDTKISEVLEGEI